MLCLWSHISMLEEREQLQAPGPGRGPGRSHGRTPKPKRHQLCEQGPVGASIWPRPTLSTSISPSSLEMKKEAQRGKVTCLGSHSSVGTGSWSLPAKPTPCTALTDCSWVLLGVCLPSVPLARTASPRLSLSFRKTRRGAGARPSQLWPGLNCLLPADLDTRWAKDRPQAGVLFPRR